VGHDVLTSLGAVRARFGSSGFAAAEDQIPVSHNRRHFLELHRQSVEAHSGVVLCTIDPDYVALAERIHGAVEATVEMRDQLIRVNRPR